MTRLRQGFGGLARHRSGRSDGGLAPRPESRALREDFAWADRLCAEAIERIAELSDFENDFVSNLASRLGRFADRTLVTDKQVEILRRIERKLGERGS